MAVSLWWVVPWFLPVLIWLERGQVCVDWTSQSPGRTVCPLTRGWMQLDIHLPLRGIRTRMQQQAQPRQQPSQAGVYTSKVAGARVQGGVLDSFPGRWMDWSLGPLWSGRPSVRRKTLGSEHAH